MWFNAKETSRDWHGPGGDGSGHLPSLCPPGCLLWGGCVSHGRSVCPVGVWLEVGPFLFISLFFHPYIPLVWKQWHFTITWYFVLARTTETPLDYHCCRNVSMSPSLDRALQCTMTQNVLPSSTKFFSLVFLHSPRNKRLVGRSAADKWAQVRGRGGRAWGAACDQRNGQAVTSGALSWRTDANLACLCVDGECCRYANLACLCVDGEHCHYVDTMTTWSVGERRDVKFDWSTPIGLTWCKHHMPCRWLTSWSVSCSCDSGECSCSLHC